MLENVVAGSQKGSVCHTDFGTESGMAMVPSIDPNQLWPHWAEDDPQLQDDCFDGASKDMELPGSVEQRLLSFDAALPVPGTEHICHNCLKHVTQHMAGYASWLKKQKLL